MAKTLALADVLACELDARLERLRALVLCDTEVARRPSEALVGVLRPQAGAAPEVVRTLAADPRTAVARLAAAGPEWRPRRWVPLATGLLEAGETRVLVGTRALVGEGWDAPCVNCLVDLTTATTGVSVRQLRGRSLRLDPGDPD
jgi:hypothetical protein